MKYLALSALSAITTQAAYSDTLGGNTVTNADRLKQFEEIIENLLDKTNADFEDGDRGLTAQDMGLLSDYGCWCYFEEAHGAGKGQPVDELDGYCKQLHDGYECIIADSVDAGIPCVPWEVTYTSAFGGGIPGGMTQQNIEITCDGVNIPNSCAAWTCKVESWFIQQYFLYSTSGGVINAANRHANGFDVTTGCPTSLGHPSPKNCCGNYPARYPFKTYDGARDCCQSHTFNTNMFVCCSDGSISIAC